MKQFLTTVLSLLLATTASAQTFSEGFEDEGTLPQEWTVRSNGGKYTWSVVKHGSGSLVYRKGFTTGGTYTMQSQTGRLSTANPAPDQWLISPQIEVKSGDYLSFMMAYAAVYNMAANTPATSRTNFAVMVSETDTMKTSFTKTLYEFTPLAEMDWRALSLSLDEFAGKSVYVAFREYGVASGGPVTTNYIWLDDVKVGSGASSDVVIAELLSPVSGYEASQPVKVKVANGAMPTTSLQLGYSINGGQPVVETYNGTLQTGDTLTYTFSQAATLVRGEETAFKVWATADNDAVHDNDSLATTLTADNLFSLPYEMTPQNNTKGWTYTYHKKSGRNYTGWWTSADDSGEQLVWTYQLCSKESLLQGKWFSLPKDNVKFTFGYLSSADAPLTVSLIGLDGTVAATFDVTLPAATELSSVSQSISVPAEAPYTVSLKVADDYAGKLQLYTLGIEKQAASDVSVASISSPLFNATATTAPVKVSAKVVNKSTSAAADVPLHLSVDGTEVASGSIASLAGGETLDYTFAEPLSLTAGQHTLAVYSTLSGDGELSNDTATVAIYAYEPVAFPIQESFEDSLANQAWTCYNPDADGLYWDFNYATTSGTNYAKDGTHVAYIQSVQGKEHNDWLITPAFTVGEAGKARLSYYYTTRYKASGEDNGTKLDAYLVKGPELTLPTDATPLSQVVLTNDNQNTYRQAYALAEIAEPGTYYVALHNTGTGHDVVIDDFRFDREEDLAVVNATHTAKTGFNLYTDTVSIYVANHGTTDQTGFTVSCKLNESTSFSKTFLTNIHPGDTIKCVFQKDGNISTPGQYTVVASVEAQKDADEFNNTWTLETFKNFANATVPYTADFDDADQQAQWQLGGSWQTGTYTSSSAAYNGTGAISHHKKAAEDGDWAISGPIEIPAGTYDLNFFYRTYLNGKSANLYQQNFALFLGTEPEASAMTTHLYTSEENVLAYDKRYRKVATTFTVEGGTYYLGAKCTSQSAYGVLYIDQISITEPLAEADELKELADSTFAGWYHYDPSSQFNQWAAATEGVGVATQSKVFSAGNPQELPGVLVSQPFQINEGTTITATLDYSMAADEAGSLSTSQYAEMQTGVFLASEDMPDAFQTAIATGTDVSGSRQSATGTVSISQPGTYWFGIRATQPTNGTASQTTLSYNVYSLKLKAESATGISQTATAAEPVEAYSVGGVRLGTFTSIQAARQQLSAGGIYILRQGSKTIKVVRK